MQSSNTPNDKAQGAQKTGHENQAQQSQQGQSKNADLPSSRQQQSQNATDQGDGHLSKPVQQDKAAASGKRDSAAK